MVYVIPVSRKQLGSGLRRRNAIVLHKFLSHRLSKRLRGGFFALFYFGSVDSSATFCSLSAPWRTQGFLRSSLGFGEPLPVP